MSTQKAALRAASKYTPPDSYRIALDEKKLREAEPASIRALVTKAALDTDGIRALVTTAALDTAGFAAPDGFEAALLVRELEGAKR